MTALAIVASGCHSGRGSLQPPAHCEEEAEYRLVEDYTKAILLTCDPPESSEDWALCARLDYLEARCSGVNAYRSKLMEAR